MSSKPSFVYPFSFGSPEKTGSGKRKSKLQTYTSIITDQSHKLNSHIEKILNIAKNDASGLSLKPQRIILLPFIQEIADTVKQKNENLSIEINIDKTLQ
jgi:two-component system phosphate regulon sensor histidine kinase PhoR